MAEQELAWLTSHKEQIAALGEDPNLVKALERELARSAERSKPAPAPYDASQPPRRRLRGPCSGRRGAHPGAPARHGAAAARRARVETWRGPSRRAAAAAADPQNWTRAVIPRAATPTATTQTATPSGSTRPAAPSPRGRYRRRTAACRSARPGTRSSSSESSSESDRLVRRRRAVGRGPRTRS